MRPKLRHALVLASASPRRLALLASVGLEAEVRATDTDETVREGEAPARYTARLAVEKLLAARSGIGGSGRCFVAADTSVVVDGSVLGKPRDDDEALAMLRRLRGRDHEVMTSVAVAVDEAVPRVRTVVTAVRFRDADDATLRRYVASGEGRDKAGAYAIQGIGGGLVSEIRGSYSSVVGLPLVETLALLDEVGALAEWP